MTPAMAEAVAARATCLFSEEQVAAAFDNLAKRISSDLSDKNPLLLCVMTGGIVAASELLRRFIFPLEIDYVHASRYGGGTQGGSLNWHHQPATTLLDRHVLLVDDIFDQGATLDGIAEYCSSQGAASVSCAVLIEKLHDRKLTELRPDYIGLTIEDVYIYGCGMDYRGYLRNRAGIYAVDKGDY